MAFIETYYMYTENEQINSSYEALFAKSKFYLGIANYFFSLIVFYEIFIIFYPPTSKAEVELKLISEVCK